MNNRITPENITELKETEIFVFGSNLAGKHGAGAAKLAKEKFGVIYGRGYGPQGKTYAIPTKDQNLKILDLKYIKFYVDVFIEFAEIRQNKTFLVTKIGCGLAGYKPEDIAPMFKKAIGLENIYLPKEFIEIIEREIN